MWAVLTIVFALALANIPWLTGTRVMLPSLMLVITILAAQPWNGGDVPRHGVAPVVIAMVIAGTSTVLGARTWSSVISLRETSRVVALTLRDAMESGNMDSGNWDEVAGASVVMAQLNGACDEYGNPAVTPIIGAVHVAGNFGWPRHAWVVVVLTDDQYRPFSGIALVLVRGHSFPVAPDASVFLSRRTSRWGKWHWSEVQELSWDTSELAPESIL